MTDSVVRFENISKTFKTGTKSSTVLNDLTLSIEKGEIFGFLGPNGAGKSTSINLLMNFIHPDSGTIVIKDALVGRDPFQQYIGYLPEQPCFYDNLTAIELLYFTGSTYGIGKTEIATISETILTRLRLNNDGNRPVRTFSKGMKQRLGVALALIHDPEIFIFDEPMSGLDPMGRRLVADVILELKDAGKTVFFSSHILSDIERLCDRIGILSNGRLLFSGPVKSIMEEQRSLEDIFIELIENDRKKNE